MLLVVGAGLFVQTLMQLGHTRLGFRPHNLLLFELQPPQTRYPRCGEYSDLSAAGTEAGRDSWRAGGRGDRRPADIGKCVHAHVYSGRPAEKAEWQSQCPTNDVGAEFLFHLRNPDRGGARIQRFRYAELA